MSFVNRRGRAFMRREDLKPERRRSEARLKTYPSAEDIRAWGDTVEERRQHILELVTKGYEKCSKRLFPLEALLPFLGGAGDEYKQCFIQLWQYLSQVDLNAADKKRFAELRAKMNKICLDQLGPAGKQFGKYCVVTKGPGRTVTKVTGIKPGFVLPSKPDSVIKKGKQTTRIITQAFPVDGTLKDQVIQDSSSTDTDERTKNISTKEKESVFKQSPTISDEMKKNIPAKEKKTVFKQAPAISDEMKKNIPTKEKESVFKQTPAISDEMKKNIPTKEKESDFKQSPANTNAEDPSTANKPRVPRQLPATTNIEDTLAVNKVQVPENSNVIDPLAAKKPQVPGKLPENTNLEDQLAAKDVVVEELQTHIEELQKEIEGYIKELEQLKHSTTPGRASLDVSCQDEINALENEIKSMRTATNLSPEEEADLIKKEVEILRGYCMRLKAVEEENKKLKKEKDTIQQEVSGDGDSKLVEDLTKERDSLKTKVKQLECELLHYRSAPADADIYKDRSEMLDKALAERDDLRKQLEKMRDMQQELVDLRQKAEKTDQFERSSKYSRTDINSDLELKKTQSKCFCLEKELHNARLEKEAMKRRIECMCKENDKLRPKAREAEMLKLERDKLQIKVNDLSHVQVHNENLTLKCKCLENAAVERDIYKQKYEDIITMECQCEIVKSQTEENKGLIKERETLRKQVKDLEACIKEQEEEIKRLMTQIESLKSTKDESQSRMKEALASMRAEVEKKENLIVKSEEELATVQAQLKSSIQGVSCETTCLRTRIEELERELRAARRTINQFQNQKDNIMCETVAAMKKELETAREENKKLQEIAKKMAKMTTDEHVQNMLRQSECAIKRVVEELNRQYREWDSMKQRQSKGRFSTKQCTCNSPKNETREIADSDNVKKDFEEIQREKEKLVSFVKQIQTCKECNCDKLRRENLQLKENLKKP